MTTTLLETGIYTIPEAARLTGVSSWRIRRWLRGYDFLVKSRTHQTDPVLHHSRPVWNGQLEPLGYSMAVGFLDLMEIRCIDFFLQEGVSWKTVRLAHDHARQILQTTHPFCTKHFKLAGRDIILELPRRGHEPRLWDIARDQQMFGEFIERFIQDLDFAGEAAIRWWPRGRDHRVALDPLRSFGQPIVFREGISTCVLARSVRANGSEREVARWFGISAAAVREAVEFEQTLAA